MNNSIKRGAIYQHIFTGDRCLVLDIIEKTMPFLPGTEPKTSKIVWYHKEKPNAGKTEFAKPLYVFDAVYKFIGYEN